MDSNRLMVPCMVPLSELKYEAFGGRETKLREKLVLFLKFITKWFYNFGMMTVLTDWDAAKWPETGQPDKMK